MNRRFNFDLVPNPQSCQTKTEAWDRGPDGEAELSTVDKALEILELFSESRPALGLSEAARLLDRDKASVLRYLSALERQGFLEQDPYTRSYHLGPAVARLALVREITYPVNHAARNILRKLVDETQETAHLSHYQGDAKGGQLTHVAFIETAYRGTRVYIDPAEPLPLHAAASGLAYLSACSPEQRARLLAGPLEAVTEATMTDRTAVERAVEEVAARGYAISRGGVEIDVCGIAAPVFNAAGGVCGAVAVAAPQARVTPVTEPVIAAAVRSAAAAISRHYGAQRLPAKD